MSKVLIIQNISREGPGLLEGILVDEGISFDIVNLDAGDTLPSANDYKAVVVLGGPDSANDDNEKMRSELSWIKEALDADLPYLGICLGLQTLVKAAGGSVLAGKTKEAGFIDPDGDQFTVRVTDEGKADPLLSGLPEPLNVFQLHGETVTLTDNMMLLASGKFCENQIVRVSETAYGIQSHFELTKEMLAVWASQDPDLIPLGSEKLQSDFDAIRDSYTQIGQTLLRNFLAVAGLRKN